MSTLLFCNTSPWWPLTVHQGKGQPIRVKASPSFFWCHPHPKQIGVGHPLDVQPHVFFFSRCILLMSHAI